MRSNCKALLGHSHRSLAITLTNTLALAFAGALSMAAAGEEPHDMTGSWGGFFPSTDNPNNRAAASFEVSSQDKRRFTGMFRVSGMICTLEGTISASGMMNAKGDCGAMSELMLHGHVTEVDEGALVPCIFEGRWTLRTAIGKDDGNLALLHFKSGPTELATGHWEGSAHDDGSGDPHEPVKPVMADFRTEFGDNFMKRGAGRVTIGETAPSMPVNEFDVFFDIAQLPDSDTHGFALVGGGEAGILVFVGRFNDPSEPGMPAMIRARHRLHLPSGDVLEGNVALDRALQAAQ